MSQGSQLVKCGNRLNSEITQSDKSSLEQVNFEDSFKYIEKITQIKNENKINRLRTIIYIYI